VGEITVEGKKCDKTAGLNPDCASIGISVGGGGGAVSRLVHKSAGRMNIHKSGGNSGCAI